MNKGLLLLMLSKALEGDPTPARPRSLKEILQARVEETVLLGKALGKASKMAYKLLGRALEEVTLGGLIKTAVVVILALLMGIL